MPTYEYACTSCGHQIEVFQRFTEDPLTTCGVCGGPLRKVFHPAGIVFKGSGFYATDSRKGGGIVAAPEEGVRRRIRDRRRSGDKSSTSATKDAASSIESGQGLDLEHPGSASDVGSSGRGLVGTSGGSKDAS